MDTLSPSQPTQNFFSKIKNKFTSLDPKVRSIVVLVVLLLAIPLTVWLLQQTQIFSPKAVEPPIQLVMGEDSCAISNDPYKASCGNFPIKLTSPLGPMPDGSFSCQSNDDCPVGKVCYNHQDYPGRCFDEGTGCPEVITRACDPENTEVCVDFPSPCHVPPGWVVQEPEPEPSYISCNTSAQNSGCPDPMVCESYCPSNNLADCSLSAGRCVELITCSMVSEDSVCPNGMVCTPYCSGGILGDCANGAGRCAQPQASPSVAASPSTTPAACNPRPDIVRSTSRDGTDLIANIASATNAGTTTNALQKIEFTSFDNVTANINGTLYTQPTTVNLPAGTTSLNILIKRVNNTQAGTLQLKVFDTCGEYPLFFGGGTAAWADASVSEKILASFEKIVPKAEAQTACPNLIKNGGLENPQVASVPFPDNWGIFGSNTNDRINTTRDFPDWDPDVNPGYQVEIQAFGNAAEGNQYAEIDAPGTITFVQTIPTKAGVQYQINFAYSGRPNMGAQKMGVYWNGTLVGEAAGPANLPAPSWQRKTFPVTGVAGTSKLGFAAMPDSPGGAGNLIDDISVVQTTGSCSTACTAPPAPPTNFQPAEITTTHTITPGTQTISWDPQTGANAATEYLVKLDDLTEAGGFNDCSNGDLAQQPGDVCIRHNTQTSFSANFVNGHTYNLVVFPQNACGGSTSAGGGTFVANSTEEDLPGTLFYQVAETEAGLDNAEQIPYLDHPTDYDFAFSDPSPGTKQIWVRFTPPEGEPRTEHIPVEIIAPPPVVDSVACSVDLGRQNLLITVNGERLGEDGGEVLVNTKEATLTSWESTKITATIKPGESLDDGKAFKIVVKAKDDSVLAEHTCLINTTVLSLGARLFCRAPGSFDVSNVKATLVDEIGNKVDETVSIDQDGLIKNLKTKLTPGQLYSVSIKAPYSLRRNATFTAAEGTNVITAEDDSNFILPVGDIAPVILSDGKINTLDRSEIVRQWSVLGANQGRTGDFNRDTKVNSIDWACMRYDFNAEDQPIPTKALQEPTFPGPCTSQPPAPSCESGKSPVFHEASDGACGVWTCESSNPNPSPSTSGAREAFFLLAPQGSGSYPINTEFKVDLNIVTMKEGCGELLLFEAAALGAVELLFLIPKKGLINFKGIDGQLATFLSLCTLIHPVVLTCIHCPAA